jgi:hypothetical protein
MIFVLLFVMLVLAAWGTIDNLGSQKRCHDREQRQ